MGWSLNPVKMVRNVARAVERNVVRPALHNPGAALMGGAVGAYIAEQGYKKNKAQMQEYHRNAERMYNDQSATARNAQAKMDAERREQQVRLNRGMARGNRARAGAIFGDENLLGN